MDTALQRLPEHTRPGLQSVTLFLMQGAAAPGGGKEDGMEHISAGQSQLVRSLDPRWDRAIVVYSATTYMKLTDHWALKAPLHELAHAHHHEHWPQEVPEIVAAWRNARTTGLYKNVMDTQKNEKLQEAYALKNGPEYFAEISVCFFSEIEYFPHDRNGLKTYDPMGYELVRKMWGLKE